jgi:HSP90 family molecular chaperone
VALFVKGVAPEDLPSTSLASPQNKILRVIKKNLAREVHDMVNEIAEDAEKCQTSSTRVSSATPVGHPRGHHQQHLKLAKLLRQPLHQERQTVTSLED